MSLEVRVLHDKNWYVQAHHICEHWAKQYGYTVPQVVAIVAVLSPLQPWRQNLRWAKEVLSKERPKCYGLKANQQKALDIKDGKPINNVVSGEKVKSFYACILRPHCNSVVIDRHMLKLLRVDKSAITKKQYGFLAEKIAARAKYWRMTPGQFQAVLWLWQRGDLKQMALFE